MKKVIKGDSPDELKNWFAVNADCPQNLFYGGGHFPKKSVLKGLLEEQGNLCAYTQLKIDEKSSHNEHVKPQKKCKEEDKDRELRGEQLKREDVDWNNLVACFPHSNGGHPGYGAVKKGNWWDENLLVTPLSVDCEIRFTYKADGTITASSEEDAAAIKTIEKLKLDHTLLNELRFEAIMGAGLHKRSDNPIMSVEEVEKLLIKLGDRSSDKYPEFCVVLTQIAQEHIRFLEKRLAKVRG